jgi:signal transduction histidine kinase
VGTEVPGRDGGRYSLRWQLVVGTLLWTAGVVMALNWISLYAIALHGRASQPILHVILMTLLAGGCIVAGLVQLRRAVSSLERLRQRLALVHQGTEQRVGGNYPAEVQPVVDDLNALLEQREVTVARAVAKAGDLAHGLKTPLAVIAQEAERAGAAGHHELAATIAQQVDRMKHQVDYHLAHARAAASGATVGTRASVRESAEGLARTLRRLYADKQVTIAVDVAGEHAVRTGREDLDEMLGNLLDNACKWARSRVVIASIRRGADIVVTVDDDGPGVEPALRDQVLRRGVRVDEAAPGSGFGLAIVRELAELYGGSIALGSNPGGGLRAELRLPHSD